MSGLPDSGVTPPAPGAERAGVLDRILAFSLRRRGFVLVAALVVAALGIVRGARMPVDVLPDLNRPTVTVLTEAPGLQAYDVELLVTRHLEQALNGAPGVFRVRSTSSTGLSLVQAEFGWDEDPHRARQVASERVQAVRGHLPEGLVPLLAPASSIMGQVQILGVRSRAAIDPAALRRLVERDLAPRLRALSGVAQVVTMGGRVDELQVVADAERLRAHGVSLPELRDAVRAAHVSSAGGVLVQGPRAPLVAVPGRVSGPADLAAAVVRADVTPPVRVGDVATVRLAPAPVRTGEAGIDGGPGVVVVLTKQPGADTVALTEAVAAELARIRPTLPEGVEVVEDLFQQAAFIHRAIDNVLAAVRDGAILVLAVLFLFLLDLRTTCITLTAIPLSIAAAAIVFAALGLSIDTMTLGGLAVAIGVLVDDAIVDVENVFRRLHENRMRAQPRPTLDVVLDACREVRRPVLYGTLLVTVVYLPLFFLAGIEGRLFAPIGVAYVVSVLASLGVALTVTPVLCYLLLGRKEAVQRYGGRLVAGLRAAAGRMARFSIAHPRALAAGAASAFTCCAVALFARGWSFLPPFNEGAAQVNLLLPPDTGLEASAAMGERLERLLLTVPGIRSVVRRTGRAEGDEHVMPVSVTEAIVTFDPERPRPRTELIEDIRARVAEEFPGVASEVEQPLAHLLSHLLSGVTAQVAIKVSGPDLAVLRGLAERIEAAVRGVDGVRDLYVEPQVLVDQIDVEPDRAALARLGLTVADLSATVALAFGGEELGRVTLDEVPVPLRVLLAEEDRATPAQVGALLVRGAGGAVAQVADAARVELRKAPSSIQRENLQRRIVVQHNVGGRALSAVVADVEAALDPIRADLGGRSGYAITVSGQFEAQQEATRRIAWLGAVAVVGMFALLVMHLRSWRLAGLLLSTRPLAFVGAAVWVLASGQELSVATLVGLIALLGMAARNAILLFDHTLHLLHFEGETDAAAAVVRAARERVVPVLMTALTSGIGLVPLALAADQPGRELLYPVATAVLGGLVTSTLLDFVLMPGLLVRALSAPGGVPARS